MSSNEKNKSRKTPQEMLMEIRNLLAPKQPEFKMKELNQKDIDSILEQSIISSQNIIKNSNIKPVIQQKINEASTILQNQNQSIFIQQYAKQKIASQIFTTFRNNMIPQQSEKYQRKRLELIRQRQIQEQQQRLRQAKVIQNTKKFKKYESKILPYIQINEFAMKEGQSKINYLLNQQAQQSTSSINNEIQSSIHNRQQNIHPKIQVHPNVSSKSLKNQQFIEIRDQDDTMTQQYIKQQKQYSVYLFLKKKKNITKIIGHILLRQMQMLKYLNDESNSKLERNSMFKSESSVKYNQKDLKQILNEKPSMQTVFSLTKKYRSKGVILKQTVTRSILKANKFICIKIISKMIGKSAQFHAKKIYLTENELSWIPDNQQITEDSKKIELVIQNIKTKIVQKEEGSFFTKKSSNVQVVVLEGTNRQLIFEKTYLEGSEVFEQLCNLMAVKIYKLNIIVSCMINQVLREFIHNKKATVFDLSNGFLQSHEKYPTKEYRLLIINILSALFVFRTEILQINLQSCRTNVEQNLILFKRLQPLKKVQTIKITETKLNLQSFSALINYISTLPYHKLNITLSSCMIDDKILIKSKESFTKITNIQMLNMSQNQFTLQGFNIISELFSNELCKIKQLNINSNKISYLVAIGELIKKAKKLQVLYAEDCNLSFDQEEISTLFYHCRQSKIKKLSLLNNDIVNNLHLFQNFWQSDTPKEINVQLGIFAEKTSKNLQGKLL